MPIAMQESERRREAGREGGREGKNTMSKKFYEQTDGKGKRTLPPPSEKEANSTM
jgi:hypothetical protein